jgi:hypothetical protein
MANETQIAFRRYAGLIAGAMAQEPARAFHPEAERDAAVQVERASVYALALADHPDLRAVNERIDRLVRLAADGLKDVVVVDRNGHQRPVYRPLLVYGGLQAFRVLYEVLPRAEFGRWDEGLRVWCDLLEADLGSVRLQDGGSPAARGGVVAQAAWAALALFAAGKVFVRDAWTDLASDTFGRLTRWQTAEGTFLIRNTAEHPETWWYHELVLLHAAGSYAVQAEDRTVAAAVARATAYHLRETQPDHATSQPWAVFPLVWNEQTRPLADQVLHGAAVHSAVSSAGGADGVSLTLLADALYCLRLFERPAP